MGVGVVIMGCRQSKSFVRRPSEIYISIVNIKLIFVIFIYTEEKMNG